MPYRVGLQTIARGAPQNLSGNGPRLGGQFPWLDRGGEAWNLRGTRAAVRCGGVRIRCQTSQVPGASPNPVLQAVPQWFGQLARAPQVDCWLLSRPPQFPQMRALALVMKWL